jgi:hypothetical protein
MVLAEDVEGPFQCSSNLVLFYYYEEPKTEVVR